MPTYTIKDTDLLLDVDSDFSVSKEIKQYVLKIHDLPQDHRPREKLVKFGPEVLSIQELLAIVLNVGTKKEDVLEMANRIMREYGEKSILAEHNPEKLALDLDIPVGKASQIVACGELGRRIYQKNTSGFVTIRTAQDVFEYLSDMRNLPKEHLRGIYLNSHSRIIHDEVLSIGTINSNVVHPREVFRPAIEYSAAAVVLAHNHPSGIVTPSQADIEITRQLISAGKLMGIHVLDHIVITKDTFVSIDANYA